MPARRRTRLNIASGALGWYSPAGRGYLWERFETIEDRYGAERYLLAATGCSNLNRIEAGGR